MNKLLESYATDLKASMRFTAEIKEETSNDDPLRLAN